MPNHRGHCKITKAFLGWDMPEVHRTMDAVGAHLGPRHRVLGHDAAAFRAIPAIFHDDEDRARIVFLMHVLEDLKIIR
jgi:hypothetical protein